MNGSERIMATLAGEAIDRRAFVPELSLYGAALTNCPLSEYYTDPSAYTRGQMAVNKAFAPDVLIAPFAFALIGAAFGSQIKFSGQQPPNIRQPAIWSPDVFDNLLLPDPDTNPYLLYIRQAVRQMVCELDGTVPVAAPLPPPTDIPALILGMEAWLDMVLFNRSDAERLMDRITEFFVSFTNALFDDGATLAVVPCGFASPTVLMRGTVQSLMLPVLDKALSQLKGPVVLHHTGAAFLAHLDLMTSLPSTIGFALNHEEGLDRARSITGPGPVLFSGPHGPSLSAMNAAQVEELCRQILLERAAAKDTRFILTTLGADVPLDTPPENILAMKKALDAVGWITS